MIRIKEDDRNVGVGEDMKGMWGRVEAMWVQGSCKKWETDRQTGRGKEAETDTERQRI